jgi:integrase/recombinase XerD
VSESPSISVREAVEDYRYAILELAPRTQEGYLHRLRVFADWCEEQHITLEGLRQAHIRQYAEYLRNRPGTQRGREGAHISTVTLHGYLLALKIFLHWCAQEEDYEQAVSKRLAERVELPTLPQKVVEVFSAEQVKAMLAACERGVQAVRNRAILLVLLDTGMRAGELCRLSLDCCYLDPEDAYLKVYGKGEKWREVPLGKKSLAALRRYITRYRKSQSQRVFLGRGNQPLTVRGLQQIIITICNRAGITGVRCSPHTFRHTFAVHFLERTGDIYRLMRLMGHSDIKITQVYLRAFQNRQARSQGVSAVDELLGQGKRE